MTRRASSRSIATKLLHVLLSVMGRMPSILVSLKLRVPSSQASLLQGFISAVTLSGFFNILQLALPLYSMQVFDRVVPTGHLATLASLMAVMVGLTCCSFAVDAARAMLMSRIASRVDKDLHARGVTAILSQDSLDIGVLSDVAMVRGFIAGPLATAVMDAPWSLVFLVAVFALHMILGWTTLVVIAVMVAWACVGHAVISARRTEALSWGATESALLQSARTDWHVTRAMGLKRSYVTRFDNAHRMAAHLLINAENRQAWVDAGARALRNFFQISILTIAALLTVDQRVQAGAIVASSMLFSRALAPVERLSASFPAIVALAATVRRIRRLRSSDPKAASHLSLPPIRGELQVNEVCVTAATRAEPLLRNVSLSLNAGAVLVIVGPEGAGKSTLARVLCGALPPSSGQVRIDGTNLPDFEPDDLGSQIGYLPETVRLEPGTVASIIARNGAANDAAIVAAAQMAGAHEMIQQLERGYQTIVRPNEYEVSAGQTQRLALARTLYGDPAIVVLDEPTAHLDDAGEALIVDVVGRLKKRGATVVIVSRLASLAHLADRLIMLEKGQVRLDADQSTLQSFAGLKLAASRTA